MPHIYPVSRCCRFTAARVYGPQLHSLKRGVHVVVGTPGRVIDHLDRGTLDLSELRFMVLDEADEMLRMGFIDDVEKVLQATPPTRQVALFSATMPQPIRKIAQRHLKEPVEVTIKTATTTAANIRQRYWWVSGMHKLDAMTRILEAEPFDAMIIFARTKQATEELAEKLQARGLAAAAINGDIAQPQRERVIQQLKDGKLDILVATDVAARGLDVDRISHVMNYDIPYDTESYVHRIGRTGRAGRSGDAILFVSPREKGMLRAIERATRQPIEENEIADGRSGQRSAHQQVQATHQRYLGRRRARPVPAADRTIRAGTQHFPRSEIAAALARIAQGDQPLLLAPPPKREYAQREQTASREHSSRDRPAREHGEHAARERKPRERDAAPRDAGPRDSGSRDSGSRDSGPRDAGPRDAGLRPSRPHATEQGKRTYRVEVGHEHGVKPGNIIGAIANEAGLESQFIGRLSIRGEYSLIDLPDGMPPEIFQHLQKVWVVQQQLRIHEWDGKEDGGGAAPAPRKGNFRPSGGSGGGGGFKGKPRAGANGGGKPPRRK